jgi:hypothetical protein
MNEVALFSEMADCRSKVWVLAHIDHSDSEECLIWPFARKGCGYVSIGGARILLHRLMCEFRNGSPPTPEHYAAHSCGRGQDGCVNPCHVRWKTSSENQLERFEHNEIQPRRKITHEQAAEIRALRGIKSADEIGAIYGISASNVYMIHTGKTWTGTNRPRILTRDEVNYIRSTPQQVKNARQIAGEFGVSIGTIHRIRARSSYQWVVAPDDRSSAHPQAHQQVDK